jgi:hypothetical protein
LSRLEPKLRNISEQGNVSQVRTNLRNIPEVVVLDVEEVVRLRNVPESTTL